MNAYDLTVLIVSSYSPFHPSTELLDTVISSLECIPFLEDCPKVIVLDGYISITSELEQPEIKRGKLTQSMVDNYEIYCHNLFDRYKSSTNVRVIKNEKHIGFAHSLKRGLEAVDTTFAMILQHDRVFCERLSGHLLTECMTIMSSNDHIRYIGFPTSSSKTHISQITSRYQGIDCLNRWEHRIRLQATDTDAQTDNNYIPLQDDDKNYYGYFLQPCIFWYDSTHLCHVERYLNIFRPYKTIPASLKVLLGNKRIKKLTLRHGDFIEDRFGQMQRKILTEIIPLEIYSPNSHNNDNDNEFISEDKMKGDEFLIDAFRWFGSYLLWQTDWRHIEKLAFLSKTLSADSHSHCNDSTGDGAAGTRDVVQNYLLTGVTSTVDGTVADCVNFSRVFVRHLHGRRKPYNNNNYDDDDECELEVSIDDDQDCSEEGNDNEQQQHQPKPINIKHNKLNNNQKHSVTQRQSTNTSHSSSSSNRHIKTSVSVDWSKVSLEESSLDALFPS